MPELFNAPGWAYLFGALGILTEWRSYALSCGIAYRRWSAGAALLWACQYFLLDAWTAGLTMGSTALRTLVSGEFESSRYKHLSAGGFVILFVSLTALSWQGPVSLLPAVAVINTTLALFYLDNRQMRVALLLSSIAWITNDLLWQAWAALLAETVAMGINGFVIAKLFGFYTSE